MPGPCWLLGLLAALAAAAPTSAGVFWQHWRPSRAAATHDFPEALAGSGSAPYQIPASQ